MTYPVNQTRPKFARYY